MPIGGQPFGTSSSPSGSSVDAITNLHGDVVADGPGDVAATIQPLAVTNGKLAANAVTNVKVAATAQIAHDKLADTTLANGAVLGATGPGPVTELPFGPVARNLGLASTTSEARAILDISDLSKWSNSHLAKANQVCGFANTPQMVDIDMMMLPGGLQSPYFKDVAGSGSATLFSTVPGCRRFQVTSGSVVAYYQAYSLEGSVYVKPLVPCANTTKWLVGLVIRRPSGFNFSINHRSGFGWNTEGLAGGKPMMGIAANEDATHWRCFLDASSTGVSSSVSIVDDAWVSMQMWSNGDGNVYFSVNGETPVSFAWTAGAGNSLGPWINMLVQPNESLDSVFDVQRLVYIFDGFADV